MVSINRNMLALVFGFARIGAPDPDSLKVINEQADNLGQFLNALETIVKQEIKEPKPEEAPPQS